MAAVADLEQDRAKLVSRASTRDLQLPRWFIRQPVLSSCFSLLFSRTVRAGSLRTNERRPSSHSWCNVDRVAVRESDKSGTGKYIHRGLHGDFEESVWIQRDGGEPAPRVTTTTGALWMAAVSRKFSWRIKLSVEFMFLVDFECSRWTRNNFGADDFPLLIVTCS